MGKCLIILFSLISFALHAQVPAGAILLRSFSNVFPEIMATVNDRHDTTSFIETSKNTSTGWVFFDRSRLPEETISGNQFISTIEDGYAWNGMGYARSEVHYQGSAWNNGKGIDTNKTYIFEWTGYFPQDFSTIASNSNVTVIFQIHGNDPYSPPFQFVANSGHGISFFEDKQGGNGGTGNTTIGALSDFVNKSHTILLTVREGKGYPGQDAFVKVELDGVQKFYRNTGQVGSNVFGYDYPKFATLYDWGKALVDPANKTRKRKFSLITTAFNIYELSDGNKPPHVDAGPTQTIQLKP